MAQQWRTRKKGSRRLGRNDPRIGQKYMMGQRGKLPKMHYEQLRNRRMSRMHPVEPQPETEEIDEEKHNILIMNIKEMQRKEEQEPVAVVENDESGETVRIEPKKKGIWDTLSSVKSAFMGIINTLRGKSGESE